MIRLLWTVAWAILVLSLLTAGVTLIKVPEAATGILLAIGALASGTVGFAVFGALARNLELLTQIHHALTGNDRPAPR